MLKTGNSKEIDSKVSVIDLQNVAYESNDNNNSTFIMILLGMIISGMIESTAFPKPHGALSDLAFPVSSLNNSRRYCDPPNMTVMVLYEMYDDSREDSKELEYDFSEMEEMDFQVEFGLQEAAAHWQWQIFLCGSLLGPLISSWTAVNFGPGRVLGLCILLAAVLGIFMSTAGPISRVVIVCVQGIIHSKILPCSILLGLILVPEKKRTSVMALLAGSRAGAGIGELIPDHLLPFIACIFAVTWFSAWVLTFSTPRIPNQKHAVPWKELLTSRVVWMSTMAVVGTELLQTAATYTLRMYLYLVYNYTTKRIFAAPMLGHLLFSFTCGKIANVIESREMTNRTASRRIFVYISHFLPAAALFITGFVGCGEVSPVILYSFVVVISGAAYSGAYPSMLDFAPNFGSVIVALVCTCGSVARLIPVLLTALIIDGAMPGSWRTVLSVSALIALVTAMLFMLRGSSRHQIWNDPDFIKSIPRRPTARLNMEERILRVLMVQERSNFTRTRACSTSIATIKRATSPKRASIS